MFEPYFEVTYLPESKDGILLAQFLEVVFPALHPQAPEW